MEIDTDSRNTSLDDKTEDYDDNPTRDALVDGMISLLKPAIDQIDERVKATRVSQLELGEQIGSLAEEIKKVSLEQNCPLQLDQYVQKLQNAKKRITVVSNVLQSVQERLNQLHLIAGQELSKQKSLVEGEASGESSEGQQ